ncbi:hypothetical protein E2C01_078195 [Portunus trituberculatus]|uniref:Uncharacterized protein n=1 Tax=Portunus trituberculatus TaxID=210409 RepID=A0A5B7IM03_PORTR|nr:hypothetical protein [Portunus trituberculatus]
MFSDFEATSGKPCDPEGGNGTPNKKVKTPVLILIVIWETETNPHSDVHKPHVLPSSNVLMCVTHGCLYRTVLAGQVM